MNVVVHVFGLLLIKERVVDSRVAERYGSNVVFTVIIGTASLLATLLHGTEGLIWAASYRLLGALPEFQVRDSLLA